MPDEILIRREIINDEEEMPRKKQDSLLKAAFEDSFADLLRFFFKDADELFDMGRGIDFVDKELLEITPDRLRKGGTKTTDMLARVYRIDGEEQWILLHLEIQGETKERFSYRMFEYYYRAVDRFNKPVVAFALFTGAAGQREASTYSCSLLGTEITYKYNTYQIFQHSDQELLDWDNPFALVVLVAKKAHLEKKVTEEALNNERTIIARRLISSGKYTKKQIEEFVLFLKNMLFVKSDEINANFDKEIAELTGGQINMPGIVEAVALIYRDEAIEKGLKEGLEEGLRKGIKEGLQKGLQKGVQKGLQKGLKQGMKEGLEQGLERGIVEGLEQGRHEEALDIAREMKKDKFPIEKIVKLTRLPVEEIQAL